MYVSPALQLRILSWYVQAFDYVLKGYCKNRVGEHFVERGDYEMVHPATNQVI